MRMNLAAIQKKPYEISWAKSILGDLYFRLIRLYFDRFQSKLNVEHRIKAWQGKMKGHPIKADFSPYNLCLEGLYHLLYHFDTFKHS